MKKSTLRTVLLFGVLLLGTAIVQPQKNKFKCLIQMTNYPGEGAFVIVSVLNEKNEYVETVKIFGKESEWYPDLNKWWAFHEKSNEPLDGITAATMAGGERSIFTFAIDEKYFNGKNKLRFESSVEDQKYHVNDILLTINKDKFLGRHTGSGYVRYIQLAGL